METNETNGNVNWEVAPLSIPDIGLIITFIDTNYSAIKLSLFKNYVEDREVMPTWFNYSVDLRYNAKGCNFILIAHFQVGLQDKAMPEFFKNDTLKIEGVTGDSIEEVIRNLNEKYLANGSNDTAQSFDGQDDND